MRSEVFRFFIFVFALSLIVSSLASFRAKDKIYTYADGGLTITEKTNVSFGIGKILEEYNQFIISLTTGSAITASGESVYSHIGSRLLPTFHLAIFSVLLGSFSGIFLSLYTIYKRNKLYHQILVRLSEVILSTPVFVFAILLLILFFYQLDLFPPGGYESFQTYYVILPGVALGMRVFARVYLFQAKEVWQESNSSFVLLLQTRGYPWKHIVFTEIFRKVFPLTLIVIMLDFSSLISGAMIVEEIFFFPGIGKSLFYSIKSMDTVLLATLLMYIGIVFYIVNRIGFHLQKVLIGEKRAQIV